MPGAVSSAQVPAVTDTSCFEFWVIHNFDRKLVWKRIYSHKKSCSGTKKKEKKSLKKRWFLSIARHANGRTIGTPLQSCKGKPLDPFKRLLNAKKNETFLLLFRKSSSILILPKVKIIFRSGCPSGCLLRYAKNSSRRYVGSRRQTPQAWNVRSMHQWAFLDFFFFYIFAFCIFFWSYKTRKEKNTKSKNSIKTLTKI